MSKTPIPIITRTHPALYDAVKRAAARKQISMAEYCRRELWKAASRDAQEQLSDTQAEVMRLSGRLNHLVTTGKLPADVTEHADVQRLVALANAQINALGQ